MPCLYERTAGVIYSRRLFFVLHVSLETVQCPASTNSQILTGLCQVARCYQPTENKSKIMDTKMKFDLMHKVVRELDDLKNSQAAVIKKITQIEAHNIELGDEELENLLSDIHEHVADNLTKVEEATAAFHEKSDKYATENAGAIAATSGRYQ